MDKFGVTIGELKEAAYGSEVFMAVNGTFAGYMLISDTIKPDAKEAIASLKKLGLHTVMLTGDSEDSAQAVGKDAGIDEIYAKLLPEDKLNALKRSARHMERLCLSVTVSTTLLFLQVLM